MNAHAAGIERDYDGFPVLMNLKQVCEKFHVTRFGMYKIAKRPGFPRAFKIGRELQWYRSEVINWVEAQRVGGSTGHD